MICKSMSLVVKTATDCKSSRLIINAVMRLNTHGPFLFSRSNRYYFKDKLNILLQQDSVNNPLVDISRGSCYNQAAQNQIQKTVQKAELSWEIFILALNFAHITSNVMTNTMCEQLYGYKPRIQFHGTVDQDTFLCNRAAPYLQSPTGSVGKHEQHVNMSKSSKNKFKNYL